jgi:carbamoyltransferase
VLLVDGKIHSIIEEERLTRLKSGEINRTYPNFASQKIQEISGIDIKDSDHRLVVAPSPDAYYRKLINTDYEKVGHHDSHNYGCYFTSGFKEKTLSISYDGGGELHVIKVFLCEQGNMVEVFRGELNNYASLAHLWGFSVANMMKDKYGNNMWKLCKDEGKIVGMAPEGRYDEKIFQTLQSIISYENLVFKSGPTSWKTRYTINRMWELGYFSSQEKREIFSYNLQLFTETTFIHFLQDLHKLYPEYRKLTLSGGLFANVKLNQKINELDWVDEIFVHPAMGDEGLPLGAAIMKANKLGEINSPFKLNNVYFGLEYSNEEIFQISLDYNFDREYYSVQDISNKINEGKIIGWFKGRFEYGPRALGNRSIVVRPTDYNTHSELNKRLGRNDIMPFAPSILKENFSDVFYPEKSLYSAEFMTLCYSTKNEWINKIPSVLQKTDKTARPHVVTKESNKKYYELIEHYRNISGIPLVLNTSFNKHNEPIIDNPKQAFDCLQNGIIDELVMEDYVYRVKK